MTCRDRLGARAAALTLVFAGAAAALPADDAVHKPEVYAADIAFFLDAFEDRAGHFFAQKEIDWDEVRAWSRRELAAVKNDADHLRLCARLVARLRDGHSRLTDCRVEWPDESNGRKWRFPKVGMTLAGETPLVTLVDPSLGVPLGSAITAIDGAPAMKWIESKADEWSDRRSYSTRRHALFHAAASGLAGWEGTTFRLAFTRPDGTAGEIEVARELGEENPVRPDFTNQVGEFHPAGKDRRNGWSITAAGNACVRLRNIPPDLPDLLDAIFSQPPVAAAPGMILDLRGNSGGGCDHGAVFARFIAKGEFWGAIEGAGQQPFAGPLVVIIDAATASAGETVAGMLGEDQRAYLIGPSGTAGMSSSKVTVKAPSGLCAAYFSVRSNMGRFNRGKGIEGIGVLPHETVDYQAADIAKGIDSQVKRAEELLALGHWPEVIDYDGRKAREME